MKRFLLIAALIIFVIALLILVVHIFFVKLLEADMKGSSTIEPGDEDLLVKEQISRQRCLYLTRDTKNWT